METEEWRQVVGYEGIYEVSSFGNARALDRQVSFEKEGKICTMFVRGGKLKPIVGAGGYIRLNITNSKGKHTQIRVHTWVCTAFNGIKPSSEHQVAHYDGNKLNNHYSNLRWATAKENAEDCKRNKSGRGAIRGELHPGALLNTEKVIEIRKLRKSGMKLSDIAKLMGYNKVTIGAAASGRTWSHIQ